MTEPIEHFKQYLFLNSSNFHDGHTTVDFLCINVCTAWRYFLFTNPCTQKSNTLNWKIFLQHLYGVQHRKIAGKKIIRSHHLIFVFNCLSNFQHIDLLSFMFRAYIIMWCNNWTNLLGFVYFFGAIPSSDT